MTKFSASDIDLTTFDKKNIQRDWQQYKFDHDSVDKNAVVYLLHEDLVKNQKKLHLYVGESINVRKRLKNHSKNPDKNFKNITVISSDVFNRSVTYDLETMLINYFTVEDEYTVTNISQKNEDLYTFTHEFYQREAYEELFDEVWEELRKQNIATKSVEEIKSSELFKLSPFKQLSERQDAIIEEIMDSIIENDTGKYLINGGPGTGKSLLLVTMFYRLIEQGKKVAIIIPQSNLRDSYVEMIRILMKRFNNGKKPNKKDVIKDFFPTPSKLWKSMKENANETYDVILCDEAHRLKKMFGKQARDLKHIIESGMNEDEIINANANHVVYMYDKQQTIRPADVTETFDVGGKGYRYYQLDSQFRVNAGDNFTKFIKDLLQIEASDKTLSADFGEYEITMVDSLEELHQKVKSKNMDGKIARMGSGYAFKWVSNKKGKEHEYDIELDGYKMRWNGSKTGYSWHQRPESIDEMGSIHTLQGVDLHYGGIVIAGDLTYNEEKQKIEINQKRYFDEKGKPIYDKSEAKTRKLTGKRLEELETYIKNAYFVLLTRGIEGLAIYVEDPKLRKYFEGRIQKK